MKSGMSITCKAILSILYQCGVKINWKGFFSPYSLSGIIHRDIKVLLWVIFGGGFGDGGCLILFSCFDHEKSLSIQDPISLTWAIFFKSATS